MKKILPENAKPPSEEEIHRAFLRRDDIKNLPKEVQEAKWRKALVNIRKFISKFLDKESNK